MTQKKPLPPLTPVRYQPNFFTIDVASIGIKDTNQQLEHPIFSLSKTPDLKPRKYDDGRGNKFEVGPHYTGLPTIWDKDLLIFGISQIMERANRGEEISPRIRFHTADVIEFCQRTKGGKEYARLDRALTRLAGATLKTTIRTDGTETTEGFHIIDRFTIKRQYDEPDGRLIYCEFMLSDWLYRAVKAREVLTLHPDYFRLRQALARRIYEIARKHCGKQARWHISLTRLHQKSGSKSPIKLFRQKIRKIIANGDLLDYDMSLESGDLIVFRRRKGSLVAAMDPNTDRLDLSHAAIQKAHEIVGEGIGIVDEAEEEWRAWLKKKGLRPTNPDAMFLSFARTWAETRKPPPDPDEDKPDLPLRARLAPAWWAEHSEPMRAYWREKVGNRVELEDGTGWYLPEDDIAREAFDREYRDLGDTRDFGDWKPPRVMADDIIERTAHIDNCPEPKVILKAWKEALRRARRDGDFIVNITDPLMNFDIYVKDLINPDAYSHKKAWAILNEVHAQADPAAAQPAPPKKKPTPSPAPTHPAELIEEALGYWARADENKKRLFRERHPYLPKDLLIRVVYAESIKEQQAS